MKKFIPLLLSALVLTVWQSAPFTNVTPIFAWEPAQVNDPARGLNFAGLLATPSNQCPGGFQIESRTDEIRCTPGPDAAPSELDARVSVPPLRTESKRKISFASLCDGDGTSGYRVQIIYVRAADVKTRYGRYLNSFRKWAVQADTIFSKSAAETGGKRHVRFVTDTACMPIIENVTLSASGDDTMGNLINELAAQGFNRLDRKYLVFADANVYCGISEIRNDDQPGALNANNSGAMITRVDAGCWSSQIAAHELLHVMGGVQLSAPNSDGAWHCTDNFDRMCNYTYDANPDCPTTRHSNRFDCKHDDYFHTQPAAASYLATHWNVADNIFLIATNPP